MQRKIKRAAITLQNNLEKERKAKETAAKKAKSAEEKVVKEREAATKKAQREQHKAMAAEAKKAIKAMAKRTKALPKVKAPIKTSARRSIIIPDPRVEVVVPEARKTATRIITQPQRFL